MMMMRSASFGLMKGGFTVALAACLFLEGAFSWSISPSSRRDVLKNAAAGCMGILISQPESSWGIEEENDEASPTASSSTAKKPFAPLDQLLPAARVKWTIDKAAQIAQSPTTPTDWLQLQTLLLVPQNYTNQLLPELPTAPAQAYLDTYQRNRDQLNVLAKPGALLVQSGEIAAWKRLKRQERSREEQDEIRAALNLYTSSLSFSAESYLLNVPAAERKQMIRNDRLPDVKQVIQSDMGVRYLIRNELLTAMDEVKAEMEYQLGQSSKDKDELLALLLKAQTACNQWFALIDPKDVEEVMRMVLMEKEKRRG